MSEAGEAHVLKCGSPVWNVAVTPDGRTALSASADGTVRVWDLDTLARPTSLGGHTNLAPHVAVTPDGRTALSASADGTLRVWDLDTLALRAILGGHNDHINHIAVTPDGRTALSASADGTVRVWDLDTLALRATLEGHTYSVLHVAVTPDGRTALSASADSTLCVWDLDTLALHATLGGHAKSVRHVAVASNDRIALSASNDGTVCVWDLDTLVRHATLGGHTNSVLHVAVTPDGRTALSASADGTVRVWDLDTLALRATLEGHTYSVLHVAVTPDGRTALSASADGTVRVWDLSALALRATLEGHTDSVGHVAVAPDGQTVLSASRDGTVRIWDLNAILGEAPEVSPNYYTNAKVVLVGESGVGKTGLALRLAEDRWEETESTHGMTVRHLELPAMAPEDTEREVWLWDFAGQPDYRLVHQLYMDETALAILVIDPQRDDPFEALGHWESALEAALEDAPTKLLVAARCDRGALTVSQAKLDRRLEDGGYVTFLTTASKTGENCEDLKTLIAEHIPWERLPVTSTPRLFRTLKDAILRLRNEGIALIKRDGLLRQLRTELPDEEIAPEVLHTVVRLLDGQGVVRRLDFGDFVLLQPEWINAYASAVVRQARGHTDEIGTVAERDVLDGNLDFQDMERLASGDEKVLLQALVQTFVERSLCVREDTEHGTQLVFPSYFKRDRPETPEEPNVVVTYRFAGPLDEIYATLVVRLHYTKTFESDEYWYYAADFTTPTGKRAGLYLKKLGDGEAELKVHFDADVPVAIQIAFIQYVHEHLRKKAVPESIVRVRAYACPRCAEPLDADRVKSRVARGKKDAECDECDYRIPLIDLIEERFGSDAVMQKVREMDREAQINLDSESLELILVGHAYTIAGEAGQIFRQTANSDHGIDGEIEFKTLDGDASGQRLYLQLKSGDSYLRARKRDRSEVFRIPKSRHADYWQAQAYDVMLVIRTSDEEIRWMNVTAALKAYRAEHGEDPKQIVFEGEPFTAESVARMRDQLL